MRRVCLSFVVAGLVAVNSGCAASTVEEDSNAAVSEDELGGSSRFTCVSRQDQWFATSGIETLRLALTPSRITLTTDHGRRSGRRDDEYQPTYLAGYDRYWVKVVAADVVLEGGVVLQKSLLEEGRGTLRMQLSDPRADGPNLHRDIFDCRKEGT